MAPPRRARASPDIDEPPKSPPPMRAVPTKPSPMPTQPAVGRRSLKKILETTPTNIGVVETRTTEEATVVRSRELIQLAKWMLRNTPATTGSTKLRASID